jgi:AcrR family transcriptional regulator
MTHQREIIAAARSVFASKGFKQTTMEDIAAVAEYGKGTIYNYFDGKEELFRLVLDDSFSDLLAIVDHALQNDPPFSRKIEALVSDLLDYALKNPESLYLMARESHYLYGSNPLRERIPELLARIASEIEAEQRAGSVTTDIEATTLAQVLMNMIVGRFTNIIYHRRGDETGAMEPDQQELAGIGIFRKIRESDMREERDAAVAVVRRVFLQGIAAS